MQQLGRKPTFSVIILEDNHPQGTLQYISTWPLIFGVKPADFEFFTLYSLTSTSLDMLQVNKGEIYFGSLSPYPCVWTRQWPRQSCNFR